MTHALLLGRIIHIDGYLHNLRPMPRGQHQQFQLSLIARGEQPESVQLPQRIQPVAGLGILEPATRLHPEPEVGELVGEATAFAAVHLFRVPAAHDEGVGMVCVSLQEPADLSRVMLTVSIEGNGIGEPHVERLEETCLQGCSLTTVLGQRHKGDALDAFQDGSRRVCAAVVHHHHIVTFSQSLLHHAEDGSTVVVRWNHHTDAPLAEHLALTTDLTLFGAHDEIPLLISESFVRRNKTSAMG